MNNKTLFLLSFIILSISTYAQDENYGYRFPKTAARLSLISPEIHFEGAVKENWSFVMGLGYSAIIDSDRLLDYYYLYGNARYYFKGSEGHNSEIGAARGVYAGIFASGFQSNSVFLRDGFFTGISIGYQAYMNKHLYFDAAIIPGYAIFTDNGSFSANGNIAYRINIGVDLISWNGKRN